MKAFLTILAICAVMMTASPAWAGGRTFVVLSKAGNNMPKLSDEQKKVIAEAYGAPRAPKIDPVKFMKIIEPVNMQEMVDSLLHGVYTDIPSEYDHYGYEIRRYMANIAGEEVLKDAARIEQEIRNIQTAKIVFDYWRRDLATTIRDMDKTMDANPGNFTGQVRNSFKYNRGVVDAFLTECKSWLDNNEAMLKFLHAQALKEGYTYEEPVIIFQTPADAREFNSLMKAQQESLIHINEYGPFAIMVY